MAQAVRRVAVTGAAGYLGRAVLAELGRACHGFEQIVALDLRPAPAAVWQPGVVWERADVRDGAGLAQLFAAYRPDAVVHLASVPEPPAGMSRQAQYAVDVLGTRNVIAAALGAGVRHLVYTSSGAAYGYHPDNPVPLREEHPLRGNEEFPYAWHKRLAEAELRAAREHHPELRQLLLRLCTVLGPGLRNQITALWSGPVVIGVRGSASPFSLIWDRDVARCIALGLRAGASGVYNLAGAGTISLREMAALARKPFLPLPPVALAAGLGLARRLGLSRHGPEQLGFLRYRPVLAADAIATRLGFRPRLASREVFALWLAAAQGLPEPACMRRPQEPAPLQGPSPPAAVQPPPPAARPASDAVPAAGGTAR
ncbi:MAG: NAD-dependent dehydratase [Planctomycetota bacterium]|nr:MAG: NAD-dependent dehydratase [Planctomycetota bacterium]